VTYVAISIGAVLGANARFFVGGWIAERWGASFPFGTFVINVTGSLLIGVILTLASDRLTPDWFRPLLAIGFLGSYTTFSTFSFETLALVQGGSFGLAAVNIALSVGGALAGVYAGVVLARLI
jgi:fluoride exporter